MSQRAGAVAATTAAIAMTAALVVSAPSARAASVSGARRGAAAARSAGRHVGSGAKAGAGAPARTGSGAREGAGAGARAGAKASVGARPEVAAGAGGKKGTAHAKPKAPTGPPLVSGAGAFATPSAGGEEVVQPSLSRPLVSNGLGSPLCRGGGGGVVLSATARANCLTSGFVAAAAPTGNYELDVHIDTGFLELKDVMATLVEDDLIQPPWIALVWVVHALLTAMQWAYLLSILQSPAMRTVADLLRAVQQTVTRPWLAVVLSVAAVLLAYRGIVKRRFAETLGEALAILAMMVAGLWMIADPIGTVGAVAGFADTASLQTLAAVSMGTPAKSPEALTDAAGQLFGTTVDGPWCYMEFGNVDWCENPARLDGKLRAAGLRIAAAKSAQIAGAGPAGAARKREAVRLLRSATTNGELFLALAANGPERNSINEEGSLLRTLCVKETLKSCVGPTAAEAEFRGEGGLIYRCAGLVLIAVGALGMMLLLTFIVVRLLGAALMSLLLLLAAPVVVLLPALGENGRARYREWAGRLFGAALTKLIWSFLLGIVLVAMKLVLALHGLGWWVQWLLLTVLWWGAFRRRHDLLGLARIGGNGSPHRPAQHNAVERAGSWARDYAWGRLLERVGERRRERSLPDTGAGRKPSSKPSGEQKTGKAPSAGEKPAGTAKESSGPQQTKRPSEQREPGSKSPATSSSAKEERPSGGGGKPAEGGGPSPRGERSAGDGPDAPRTPSGGEGRVDRTAGASRSADGEASSAGRRGSGGQSSPHGGGDGRRAGTAGVEQEDGAGDGPPSPRSEEGGGGYRDDAAEKARRQRARPAEKDGEGAPGQRLRPPRGGPGASGPGAGAPPGSSSSSTERRQPSDAGRATFDDVVQRIREDAAARRGDAGGGAAGARRGGAGSGAAGATGSDDASGPDPARAARARRRRRQLGEG